MRKRSAYMLCIDGRVDYKSATDPGHISLHV